MTQHTTLFRLFSFFVITGLAMLGIAGSVSAQKVHLLTVADSHSNLAEFVVEDECRFSEVMTDGLSENRIVNVNIDENTPQKILKALRELENVGADDAVVFYYTGHGAWDQQKGLYYTITSPADSIQNFRPDMGEMYSETDRNGNPNTAKISGIMKKSEDAWIKSKPQTLHLLKSDVIAAIQRHRPRLTVVISDCCSSHGQYIAQMPMAPAFEPDEIIKPLFRKLFLETTGLVDFCAAQEERAGYSYARTTKIHGPVMYEHGSAMSFALTDAMTAYKNRTMDWASLFVIVQDQTRKNANANTMRLVKQDLQAIGKAELIPFAKDVSQYPKAFALGNRSAAARGAGINVLGMSVGTLPEGGVAVTKVNPKTAAAKAGFEVNDVITEVNDQTVRSQAEFDAAVAASGTVVNFTVIDKRTKKATIFPMSIYLPSE